MPSQRRSKGKGTKRAAPASYASQQAGSVGEEGEAAVAEEAGGGKRAKTWADADGAAAAMRAQKEALKQMPKLLTLTLVGGGEGGERALGVGLSGKISYKSCVAPTQVASSAVQPRQAPAGRGRGRGRGGRGGGGRGGGGRGSGGGVERVVEEKVELEWRVVREGATEADAAALGRRSRPVAALPSSSSSTSFSSSSSSPSSSLSVSSSSASSSPPSSSSAASSASSPLGGGLRLQLRHRRLRSEGKEGDGEFVPLPIAGSKEEKQLMRARGRKAKGEHGKKIQELEEAIRNNHIEFERLTNDDDADDDDITTIARERKYLKTQLKLLLAEDAEAKYELRGEDVWYEVGLGRSVLLEELPGRPRVVWSVEGGPCASLRSAWQSSHSVPYAEGRMSGEVDVSRLEYERSIGSKGNVEGEFQDITGIAVGEDNIYVAEGSKNCISVFGRRGGAHVRSWGSRGAGNTELYQPHGVAVDDAHVYVADSRNHRVQVFTKAGAYVRSVGSQVEGPVGVSVDGDHIAVCSSSVLYGDKISLFEKGSGRFVRKIGSRGRGHGQFHHPNDVALDGDHVYVSDSDNHRVQVLTKEGVFVRVIGGGEGSGPGQLQYPSGVAVDEEHVFVCDYGKNCVQIFKKADGVYVREVRRDAADGLQALHPNFISLQGERMYVADGNNMRVAVFRG